nr:cation-translocating P-type ATPase [Gordonia desulfuricans]
MSLFSIPRDLANIAIGAALVGGESAVRAGRWAGETTVSLLGSAGAAAGEVIVEAVGGTPARRIGSHDGVHWIEVRGLDDHFDAVSAGVRNALTDLPGVTDVHVNGPLSRVVVTIAAGGPSARELVAVIDDAERRATGGATGPRRAPLPCLPGDDALLAADLLGTGLASATLAVATVGRIVPIPVLSRVAAAPVTTAVYHPRIRAAIDDRLGVQGADLLLSSLQALTAAATAAPLSALVTTTGRALQTADALTGRRAWRDAAPRLAAAAHKTDAVRPPSVRSADAASTGRRWEFEEISVDAGLVGAGILAFTSAMRTAADAALVGAPKASVVVRDSFATGLSRGLYQRHGTLVMNPTALRHLGAVDTLLVDPRVLYTDELTITRVTGVPADLRSQVWRAAIDAFHSGLLEPGWNPLSGYDGAGPDAAALVSPVRQPLAAAVLMEARRAGLRVVAPSDDGLHSLRQGFDDLLDPGTDPDAALADAALTLRRDGAHVALIGRGTADAARAADLAIGMFDDVADPAWAADVLVPDLAAAWRILHALPGAREAVRRGKTLSTGGSLLGTLMLIPSVPGDGPGSVDASALYAFWSGFSVARGVFGEAVPEPDSGHDWHALPTDEVRRLLPPPAPETAPTGLAAGWEQVNASAPVRIPRTTVTRAWRRATDFTRTMREDLADPITPILSTGAAASALLGSPLDAVMVSGVLLLNTAISAQQSLHAERILQKMLAVQEPLARRLIDADQFALHGVALDYDEVRAGRLRPGDVIEVRSGEVIPADARIVDADTVEVDESALTGESLPVVKNTADTPGAPLAERTGMLFAGTTMVAGKARAVVTAAGDGTQVNRALALAPAGARDVGLAHQLGEITKRALPWSLAGGALVGVLSLLRGTPIHETAAGTVSIGVAAVPEGLPLVVTLAQSASARRLTGSSVLVRNPRAIEAFARLDAVCFDKTGTLSENRLRVSSVRPLDGADEVEVLRVAGATMLVNRAGEVEHATDAAIHTAATDAGLELVTLTAFLPFQSGRPLAAALVGDEVMVKGAPEALLPAVRPADRDALRTLLDEMAADGLRVLAVARREVSAEQSAAAAGDPDALAQLCTAMQVVGVIGLSDTPRAGAPELLGELRERGIGVRLITGDHPVTAAVVARDLGLTVAAEQVMTGAEWDLLDAGERAEAARTHHVFARMSPEHKVQVVQALESAGMVTAMVGDGANDAAAIRAASVGVGVVSSGSDPARMAADVMLLGGDIGALIDALDEGEQLWRRVQSAVSVLLGHNVGEVSFGLITTVLTGSPALNARQMLLVNMLTDALPAAALAVSPQMEPDVVGRHDEATIWRAVAVRGVFTTLGATLAWAFGRVTGPADRAATIGLIGLVVTQMIETLTDSHGPLVVATNVGTLATMAGIISIPGISQVFGCTPVGPIGWGQAFAAAFAAAGIAKAMPGVIDRLVEDLPELVERISQLLVDRQDADAHEDGVHMLERGREQADAGVDEGIGAEGTGDLRHGW